MDKATFNCPHCGALYGIMLGRRPAPLLAGRATCEVCEREMIRWSTPSRPAFHLIERPEDRVSTTRIVSDRGMREARQLGSGRAAAR